jgi:hypothetical protein
VATFYAASDKPIPKVKKEQAAPFTSGQKGVFVMKPDLFSPAH